MVMANSTIIHIIYKKLLHDLEKREQLSRENQAKSMYKPVPGEETYVNRRKETQLSL